MSGNAPRPARPTYMQVVATVLAAGFGVQSEQNRLRDFQSGSPKAFILVGIAGTIAFILTIYLVVRLVLAFAGV
jgi:Protein of unknown function (DUF2970)